MSAQKVKTVSMHERTIATTITIYTHTKGRFPGGTRSTLKTFLGQKCGGNLAGMTILVANPTGYPALNLRIDLRGETVRQKVRFLGGESGGNGAVVIRGPKPPESGASASVLVADLFDVRVGVRLLAPHQQTVERVDIGLR